MFEGLLFLFFFSLYLSSYSLRLLNKHKRKEKQQQEKGIAYLPRHLPQTDKTLEALEYGQYGESTAELDLEDEES
jgi:hypothetical protein